jgi:hypothetical protein
MNTPPHDFVTVDMRGLKAALVTYAKTKRSSVSVVVRDAVARELEEAGAGEAVRRASPEAGTDAAGWVKLSVRVTRTEADRLAAGARAAGLSRSAFLVGLSDGVPVLRSGCRPEHIASLMASCAELSTFSRNAHRLATLLGQGNVKQALVYRDMLDRLTADVHKHLRLAARALSELRPPRTASHGPAAVGGESKGRAPWREA